MATIFKSPFDWSKPEMTTYRGNYEREVLKRIIKRNPEIFGEQDIYLDKELKSLLKKSFREKRKLLDK